MSSGWTLQKQKRAKGLYWQAVCGKGKDRRAVTLGYLTEEEAEAGLVRLRSLDAEKARKVVDVLSRRVLPAPVPGIHPLACRGLGVRGCLGRWRWETARDNRR